MSSTPKRERFNDCGCCSGNAVATPAHIHNRSGLSSIAYRTGDYHSFKDSMLSRLSSSKLPALKGLSTRDLDDYSIALIDAWASVSDVLCFYQEYFANEGLLRTAKERMSVLEHARLIGYQLNPGVSASTFLAFMMDEPVAGTDNPFTETTIAAGSQVQSTPGPDETAQMFETDVEIQARVDWNALRPRLTQPQVVNDTMESVVINGITTFVKPGDELLIVNNPDDPRVKKVMKVIPSEDTQTTHIKFSGGKFSPDTYTQASLDDGSFAAFDEFNDIDESVIRLFLDYSWKMEDVIAIADIKHWDIDELMLQINAKSELNHSATKADSNVYGFRKRANLFGYNAQKRVTYNSGDDNPVTGVVDSSDSSAPTEVAASNSDITGFPKDISEWEDWEPNENLNILYLDNNYPEIVPGSYFLLDMDANQVEAVQPVARTEYGISSRTSKITLEDGVSWSATMETIREASLFVQSEALDLAQVPINQVIQGDNLVLGRADLYLRNQQYLAISGDLADQEGVQHSEVLQIEQVRLENGFTLLVFTTSLIHQYQRDTVTINANIAPASHGESVSEILGSGDASIASQSFSLKQIPLTYTSADVPSGSISSLEIRVNDVLWHEVETFLDHKSDEKIYTTKLNDDGAIYVLFGSGVEGARLPSGNNNIIASYRKGIGLGGLIKAKQLNLLLTRPLGVKDAVNPLESAGADDPEVLDDARSNAPLGLLTLGRAVSLSDYEDFSRAFAGVSKARAVAVAIQGVQSVNITVAGPGGAILDTSGETYKKLLSALQRSGDPYTHFSILSYRPAFFKFDAGLYVHSDYQSEFVLEVARQAMRTMFAFEARSFNQPVHLSEVIRTLQQVEGVIAVDVNYFYRSDLSPESPPPQSIMPRLFSPDNKVIGAELITLDPAPLDQLRVKS